MRKIAETLVAYETASNQFSKAEAAAAFHVAEKLRPHLANLMGVGGFRALLSRALVLANAEVSWLGKVRVEVDGTLEGLKRTHLQLDQAEFLEGSVVLLAQLLGLLAALIGLSLTLQQLNEIWPDLDPATWVAAGEEVQSAKTR